MGGNKTGIGWTDTSWNITEGCMHAGTPACDHCYAEEFAGRFADPGKPFHGLVTIRPNGMARWTGEFRERPDRLTAMVGWRNNLPTQFGPDGDALGPGENGRPRRQRVFIGSMTDTFHEKVSDTFLAAAFAVFAALGDTHTIQILTKRPARARAFFDWLKGQTDFNEERLTQVLLDAARSVLGGKFSDRIAKRLRKRHGHTTIGSWPLDNVHLGATVENEDAARRRILDLIACPAELHWLSMEPLFEGFDLGLPGTVPKDISPRPTPLYAFIRWVVCGLESGHRARPGHLEHMMAIQQQCVRWGVRYFGKQIGSRPMLDGKPFKVRHPHGSMPGEWLPGMQLQEFPDD